MSAAEFFVATSVSIPIILAGHEFARLYAIKHTAEVIMHQTLSQASLMTLFHITQNSFPSEQRTDTQFEINLEKRLSDTLKKPIFNWSWNSGQNKNQYSIRSIRVTATGPNTKSPTNSIHLSIHVCVGSWLEPMMRIRNDNRTCLGEYSSKDTSRGITFHLSGTRVTPVHLPIYYFGLYDEAQGQL